MKSHGELTAELGEYLRKIYGARGLDVLHDHGKVPGEDQRHIGKIIAWFGSPRMPERSTELGQLDIAVVREPDRALVLIEVEETNDKPKTILGDAFATLFGSQIAFDRHRIKVDESTRLILLVHSSEEHTARIDYLLSQIDLARRALMTGNGRIGMVRIVTFADMESLKQAACAEIDEALHAVDAPAPVAEQPAGEPAVQYRILQRTQTDVEVIAEIRDGEFSGTQADYVREELEYWGYPAVPLDEAMYRFRFANSTLIGFERIPPLEEAK